MTYARLVLFHALCALLAPGSVNAEMPYVGISIGAAEARATTPRGITNGEYRASYALLVGQQFSRYLAAELEYVGLQPTTSTVQGQFSIDSASVAQHGPAVFAVASLPVGPVDIGLKLGVAYLQSSTHYIAPGLMCIIGFPDCQHQTLNERSTHLAGGIMSSWTLNKLQLRTSYERFAVSGTSSNLISAGAVWHF
jgi:hypothetical protein